MASVQRRSTDAFDVPSQPAISVAARQDVDGADGRRWDGGTNTVRRPSSSSATMNAGTSAFSISGSAGAVLLVALDCQRDDASARAAAALRAAVRVH